MGTQDFCYWLQGFFELTGQDKLDETQVKMIKEHLALVFKKETTITINPKFNPYNVSIKPMYTDTLNDYLVYDPNMPVSC